MDLSFNSIEAPSECTYSSFEEAFAAFKEHGIEHGYGFRIKQSRPPGNVPKTRIYYICDKAGIHESKAKVRDTSTRRTNCPFSVLLCQKDDHWIISVKNPNHNHARSIDPRAHNVYRKRSDSQVEMIKALTSAGVQPKQIMTAIRQEDPTTYICVSDIRNERKLARKDYLQERSPIETLLDELSSTEDWIYEVKLDTSQHVQNLFFAHKSQAEMLLTNPDVLLMDCTYRTNKFKLPLLHVLGCTNLQTYFSAAFCFLRTETELDYYWALSTLISKFRLPYPQVFISDQADALKNAARLLLPTVPQLLCVWHINKNVLTKVQYAWRDADGETSEDKEELQIKREGFMKDWNQVRLRYITA
jgi:hypothetical protein